MGFEYGCMTDGSSGVIAGSPDQPVYIHWPFSNIAGECMTGAAGETHGIDSKLGTETDRRWLGITLIGV